MKNLILNIILLTLSAQVSASLVSSIENGDDNRYNKISFEIYENGPIGKIYVSVISQDDVDQGVLSVQMNLPFSDYDRVFNTEETVAVSSKELSYRATGKFESRQINFTLNEFQENGTIWDRTVVSIVGDQQGFLVTVKLYTRLSGLRRFLHKDGLRLNSVTKTRLSLARHEGINSYNGDGELLGTTFTKNSLLKLVQDKSLSSIQENCELNCIEE